MTSIGERERENEPIKTTPLDDGRSVKKVTMMNCNWAKERGNGLKFEVFHVKMLFCFLSEVALEGAEFARNSLG